MIFTISEDLISSIESKEIENIKKKEIIECINRVVWSYKNRNHMLLINLMNINRLLKIKELDKTTLIELNHLKNMHSQLGVYKESSLYAEIGIYDDIFEVVDKMNKKIIKIPFEKINDGKILERTKVFVEDKINDGKMYAIIVNSHVKKYGTYKYAVDFEHGGGSSIANLYESEMNKKEKFCIAVSDSDKTYCKEEKVQGVWYDLKEKGTTELTEVYCIEARMLENMIPYGIIKNSIPKDQLVGLEKVKNSLYSCHLKYHNYKKGLKKQNELDEKWSFLNKQLNLINDHNKKDFLLDGSKDLAKNILMELSEERTNVYDYEILDYQIEEYKRLSKIILDWGCVSLIKKRA